MSVLFVLEESVLDMRIAEAAALSAGFTPVTGQLSAHVALSRLLATLTNSAPLPDAFLIDLDLGHQSGYDVLRLRHTNLQLRRIPAIVWTRLDQHNKELCEIFDITGFVDKDDRVDSLVSALKRVVTEAES